MLAICLPCHLVSGQERPASHATDLVPVDTRSCFFADDEVSLLYSAADEEALRITWSLMANGRTLEQGTSEAAVLADSCVQQIVVKFPTPHLRVGIVLAAELQTTWISDNAKHHLSRPLTIFSRDPFSSRRSSLENTRIKLFDSDGKTAELFERYDIPHTRLLNLSAIELVTEGLVLVGEGVSFRKQRRLSETLLRAAQRGVSVLCLAPSDGNFPLNAQQSGQPSRLILDRGEVVRRYDKHFDSLPTICPLSLVPQRKEVVIGFAQGNSQWSWLNMEFPSESPNASSTKLIVCGLGMVTHWEESPVPRYLFVHLLDELSPAQLTEESQENVPAEN
ncbi:hypothetical protein Pr1d_38370 [Bythopirellula goksoeyrii]|uniref:Uncharacterized protein n=2 Tax=Bythopirellula goksoeyrii TaxID=1400387 RepID=A0A5B9QRC1_9BACT|nr:hypothetical protein Pr1d_38370 [Bythopirellula goksoeyrii]